MNSQKMLNIEQAILTRKDDFLNRRYFSDNISESILNYEDVENASLTIGLYGKWGYGKTSIINMIVEKLEEKKETIIFKFEPWIYSDTQQLTSCFFKEFSRAVSYSNSAEKALRMGEELETYADFFKPLSLVPEPVVSLASAISSKIFGGFGSAIKKWAKVKSKNLPETKISIEKHLLELNKIIIIIIDDIDRLNNTEIRQIFQMVKILGNFPNTIYLLAMDRDVVTEALSEVQKGDGSEYLEKIINVPFDVPTISKNDVYDFLFRKLDEIIKNINEEEFDQRYWGNIFHSGFKAFFLNIRDVIRYINVLKFNYSVLKNNVNIIDLIAITGFQVFEPKVYEIMKGNSDKFSGNLSNTSYNNQNKEEIKLFLEESSSYLIKISKDEYIPLLQKIFPKIDTVYNNMYYDDLGAHRKSSRACSPDYFNLYFTMTIDDKEISNGDIREYINSASSEDQFRKNIMNLNTENKIQRFLVRLQDFTTDIEIDKFQNIFNVLMDLGDFFPKNKVSMFGIDNKMNVMRVFYQLSHRLEDKEKRYELFKNSINNAVNSIGVSAYEVSLQMQQHGEYENTSNTEQTLTHERLQDLKVTLKTKIEKWVENNNFIEHRDGLSILYLWKKLDKDEAIKHVINHTKDIGLLLQFLSHFVSIGYSHSSGDYTQQKRETFNYDDISDFIVQDNIIDKIRAIKGDVNFIEYEFVITNFINMYDKGIKKENSKVELIENQ